MKTFAKNAEKQIYQVEIMKKFFPQLASFPDMFPTHSIAIQAFCLLLDFVYQHSPNLVKKLSEPVFENYTDRLILANHSLSQLNIIDDARHTGKWRSVSSLLNNCVTTMGKRQFRHQLHYPITHQATLQASYDTTEHLLAQGEAYFLYMRQKLSAIGDLEKFARKIVLRKVQPKNLTALAEDLTQIEELYGHLEKDTVLCSADKHAVAKTCRSIKADLARVFDLEVCRPLADISEPSALIRRGISPLLDELLQTSVDGGDKLEAICNYLSNLIQQSEKKVATATTCAYVKIHETAKSHAVLVCTSRRTELLKAAIEKGTKEKTILTYTSKYSQQTETFAFDLGALEYLTQGNSKTEKSITSRQIRELTSENEEVKGKLVREMNMVFQQYITGFAKYDAEFQGLIQYVTEMDMWQNKAYTAHKYNYCKPVLEKAPKAFFRMTGLRHPLIEHLQTNELYVTNDMTLGQNASSAAGTETNGILLYGTNAVGKTSFIKAVGIAVLMAQAGLYVPCQSFTYSPYQQLFTRILGNDNLFKGLSTFAVEMTELRTILTQANAYSLVLGDELCSGTESDSALSIFTAGLEVLHQKESTFLFATHFHEINKYAEIAALTKMKMMHMAVRYNKETNLLIYDRKLREGPGESMYGLEVCKSLNLPDAFLQRAHEIRMKYQPEKQNILALAPTHFNAKKLVGNCEICLAEKASEVHHLQHQKKADKKNEYITSENGQSFHKNHIANLLNICEACHKTIHKEKAEHKVVKTSQGYILSKL
jgi:DNA mismatch repair protein MutS